MSEEKQLTLSCIGKRAQVSLHVPEYFKEVFETWTFKGATLTYTKHKKQFWVRLVFETNNPPKLELGDVLGIDRGIYHLASTSTGQFFSGSKIRASQRRYLHNPDFSQVSRLQLLEARLGFEFGRFR